MALAALNAQNLFLSFSVSAQCPAACGEAQPNNIVVSCRPSVSAYRTSLVCLIQMYSTFVSAGVYFPLSDEEAGPGGA